MPSIETDVGAADADALPDDPPQEHLTAEELGRVDHIVEHLEDEGGLVERQAVPLTSGVRASAFGSGEGGVEFEVDQDAMEREADLARGIFRDPEFIRRMNQVGNDLSDDDNEPDDDTVSKFERKRRAMTDAFPGDPERAGLLYKRVRKFGNTLQGRPPPNALVSFHYNLYKEDGVGCYPEPFDSTRQHFDARPYNKRLGGDLIPGIDWALGTMCKGERALFYIHSDAFLGDKGALDRIPGGVPILADIELINFCDSASVDAFYSKDEEERRLVPFKVQLGVVQSLRHAGSDLYAKKLYVPALSKFRSAESVLTSINLTSDEEEQWMNKELAILHVNKAIALYYLGRFPSVVRECNEALKRVPGRPKALLWRGKALCCMGRHADAAASLAECQRVSGGLSSASRASVEAAVQWNNDEQRRYNEDQRRLYRRMGAGFAPTPEVAAAIAAAAAAAPAAAAAAAEAADPESDRQQREMRARLEKFLTDPAARIMNVPKGGMSPADAGRLLDLARGMPGLRVKDTAALVTITKVAQVFE